MASYLSLVFTLLLLSYPHLYYPLLTLQEAASKEGLREGMDNWMQVQTSCGQGDLEHQSLASSASSVTIQVLGQKTWEGSSPV